MATRSKNFIIKALLSLKDNKNIKGKVNVDVSEDGKTIDISWGTRKYVGRVELRWRHNRFIVYLMDKDEGRMIPSDKSWAKQAYLVICDTPDARKFIKWYELTTQLAALTRTGKTKA